jgi:site-specific recombinase XerD
MSRDDKPTALVPIAAFEPSPLQPVSHTRASTDAELVASWLAGMHSEITRAKFAATADRFLTLLADRGLTLRTATVEDVREAIEALGEGKAASSRVQYAQRAKSLISYAHRLGYVLFNAGAAVRVKGGTVDRAKRIASETEIALLIRAAPSKRDRLLIEVGYAGGLRVSELVALRWSDVLARDGDRVQISVIGKGDKLRHVLLPAIVSRSLLASRGDAPANAPLFPSRKGGAPLDPRQVNRILKAAVRKVGANADVSAHWLRHAHASHSLKRGADVADVKETLGHANIATTSIYLHSSPERSSGLVLDEGVFFR